ncbi:Uncharacterised protein [Yersinia rohdei]|uniref:hypothetical protein n=1 Tax=Yersinia rohdei TaxID=29485 RepID=UPI00061BE408|nr:hypothetical protein [Yersinia rohdei]CNE40470.1 Uncharacterised protein [Yersinia rohdei]
MSSEGGNVRERMAINADLAFSDGDVEVIKKYLTGFSLSLLQRIFISRNNTLANSTFQMVANKKDKLIEFIVNDVFSDKKNVSLSKIDKIIRDIENNIFPESVIAWIKNDEAACYFFWWNLMTLEWRMVFSVIRPNEIHHYNNYVNAGGDVYVSNTFNVPSVISGQRERYKTISMILTSLPFKKEETNILVSYISREYKDRKAICKNDVNITSLIKSKESVDFSIRYLKKKKLFLTGLEPLAETENKYALITQLYLLATEDGFNELASSLTKAWSQKKVRERKKELDNKKIKLTSGLSKESIKMLNELSKKYKLSHVELMDWAVQSLFDDMKRSINK